MATTTGKSFAAAVLLLALVAATVLIAPAEASTMTMYRWPGCSGRTKNLNNVCGCYDISGYQGGYRFVYTMGQKAYLHRWQNCGDRNPLLLNKQTRYCRNGGYKSVRMMC